jgi:hypothetical protein
MFCMARVGTPHSNERCHEALKTSFSKTILPGTILLFAAICTYRRYRMCCNPHWPSCRSMHNIFVWIELA